MKNKKPAEKIKKLILVILISLAILAIKLIIDYKEPAAEKKPITNSQIQNNYQNNYNKYQSIYTNNNVKDWINYPKTLSLGSTAKGNIENILKNNIKLEPNSSSLDKAIKIGAYVLKELDSKRG